MNAHVTPHRGTVALIGLSPADLDGARDAAVLAGARVCSNPGQASLILASASAPVPEGAPCVRVGQGGQVRLPGDSALLVSLIAEACVRTRRSGAVWAVAGIAGGVGATGIVRLLARERGRRRSVRGGVRRRERGALRARSGEAVVVDASGSVPGVALAAGIECKAMGALGCAICCVERGEWDGETYPIVAVKAAIVDGERIKADTWYQLKNGEFVEVK